MRLDHVEAAQPKVDLLPRLPAFVLLRQGQKASVEEIMRFVEERVAPYKKVREIEFVEAIPKTPSGKILRRELIEQERAKSAGS